LASAHYHLAISLQQQKQDPAALDALNRAIQIDPAWAEARFSRGNLLYAMSYLQASENEFKNAILLKPDFLPAHEMLLTLYLRQNRYDQARWVCQRLLQLDPKNRRAQKLLEIAR
jgi:tetratricopeptide (TPR) repeat protein